MLLRGEFTICVGSRFRYDELIEVVTDCESGLYDKTHICESLDQYGELEKTL